MDNWRILRKEDVRGSVQEGGEEVENPEGSTGGGACVGEPCNSSTWNAVKHSVAQL